MTLGRSCSMSSHKVGAIIEGGNTLGMLVEGISLRAILKPCNESLRSGPGRLMSEGFRTVGGGGFKMIEVEEVEDPNYTFPVKTMGVSVGISGAIDYYLGLLLLEIKEIII